jgi:hypothetical protein
VSPSHVEIAAGRSEMPSGRREAAPTLGGWSMALLEDALGDWGGVLVGAGAVVAFPVVGSLVGSVIRPAAKVLIRGALVVSDGLTGLAGAAAGQLRDLVDEARAASGAKGGGSPAARSLPTPIRP